MNTLRPALDMDLITKILEIKPKYITTTAFLNLLLEDAYNARCKNEKNMPLYTHKYNQTESKKLDDFYSKFHNEFSELSKLVVHTHREILKYQEEK